MTITKKQKQKSARGSQVEESLAAARDVAPEMAALKDEEVLRVTANVKWAAAIVLGALPNIEKLKAVIVREMRAPPVAQMERLRTYALAAVYADARHEDALGLPNEVVAIMEEAEPAREALFVAAKALAHRGHLARERVDAIVAGKGNLDTAHDLIALGSLFREAWPAIARKTAVDEAEVKRASELGTQLLAALGGRDVDAFSTEPLASERARAFTLLVRAYDAVRRAVTLVRWNERDADVLAPSLFRRPKRARAKGEEEADDDDTDVDPSPVDPSPVDPSPVDPSPAPAPPASPTGAPGERTAASPTPGPSPRPRPLV
jgi:hypothetical protein